MGKSVDARLELVDTIDEKLEVGEEEAEVAPDIGITSTGSSFSSDTSSSWFGGEIDLDEVGEVVDEELNVALVEGEIALPSFDHDRFG